MKKIFICFTLLLSLCIGLLCFNKKASALEENTNELSVKSFNEFVDITYVYEDNYFSGLLYYTYNYDIILSISNYDICINTYIDFDFSCNEYYYSFSYLVTDISSNISIHEENYYISDIIPSSINFDEEHNYNTYFEIYINIDYFSIEAECTDLDGCYFNDTFQTNNLSTTEISYQKELFFSFAPFDNVSDLILAYHSYESLYNWCREYFGCPLEFYGLSYHLSNWDSYEWISTELQDYIDYLICNEYTTGETNGYKDGYENGYDNGLIDGEKEGYTDGLVDGYDDGFKKGFENGYDNGLTDGIASGYEEGYDKGLDFGYNNGYSTGKYDGLNEQVTSELTFKELFFDFVDAPRQAIENMLNFEILGVNVSSIIFFLISTAFVVFIIRFFRK